MLWLLGRWDARPPCPGHVHPHRLAVMTALTRITVIRGLLGVPVLRRQHLAHYSSPTAEMPRSRHILGRPLSLSAKYAIAEGCAWVISSAHWHVAPCFSSKTRTVAHEKRTMPRYPKTGSTCSRKYACVFGSTQCQHARYLPARPRLSRGRARNQV